MTTHRRNTRLSSKNYFGRRIYFVTICCDQRRPYLGVAEEARRIVEILFECARGQSFRIHAYCIMPDHIHILAEGAHDRSDLREFVRVLKQRTAYEFRKAHGRSLWEMSYYDHILRQTDHIEDVASYIWWNPVRKHLCIRPEEFPFSGSRTIEWIKRAANGTSWAAPWKKEERV